MFLLIFEKDVYSLFSLSCLCNKGPSDLHPLMSCLSKEIVFIVLKLKTKIENADI